MSRVAIAVVIEIALGVCPVSADEPCNTECRITRARSLLERGDAKAARSELVTAYKTDPRPDLLFALGQVELNLGNFQVAIDYYEKFIATEPGEEQVSLAEQAIGAARMRLSQPEGSEPDKQITPPSPTPTIVMPPPVGVQQRFVTRPRQWDLESTGIAALGGAAIAGGGVLLYYAQHKADDHSGTLSEYDGRLHDARITRLTGAGVATAGVLAIGVALLRWRMSGGVDVIAAAGSTSAAMAIGGRW
jgi:tetratricopeptide (TPR) repeat protein